MSWSWGSGDLGVSPSFITGLIYALSGPHYPLLLNEELEEIAQRPESCSEVLGP